jgi:hypothetical protein
MKRIALIVLLAALALPLEAQKFDLAKPVFKQTTADSVLLRYKFAPGWKTVFAMTVDTAMSMKSDAETQLFKITIILEGHYTVRDALPDGGANLEIIYTRFAMKGSGPQGNTIDSEDPTSAPEGLDMLKMFVDKPILITIDSRGQVKSMNVDAVVKALQDAGKGDQAEQVKSQLQEYVNNGFTVLAEKPVKAGDLFTVGEKTNEVAGLGRLTIRRKYRVAAVSADKKQALLEPADEIESDKIDMSKSTSTGWLLFDLENGDVRRYVNEMKFEFSVEQNGTPIPITADVTVLYENK